MKFSELGLEPTIQAAIDKLGYQECTPIQADCIPLVQAGKDVSGLAQTGTGKTAAFLIPLMDRILKWQKANEWNAQNFILVLVPTRELAEQVLENVEQLGAESNLKGVSIYGGTGYDKQKEGLKNHVDFVVATPGRLIDLYKEHFVDLKQVRAIVFDEADRMFDMGFKDDMKYVLQRVPKERQFLVFSATMNFDVLNTAYQFGADPVEINVSRDQARAENVKDEILHVGHQDKPKFLLSLLKKHNPKQAIIFSNFKMSVEKIAQFLTENGVPGMAISSLLTQQQRNRVIEQFKAENEKNILVATDVAARGLDIKGVDMVINYEMPNDAESYVHRIGRTGRAGTEGRAYSLVSDRDVESLARVEDYLKHKLATAWMEDSDLVVEFKPMKDESGYRSRDDRGRGFRENDRNERGGERGRGGPRNDRGPRGGSERGERPQLRGPQAARPVAGPAPAQTGSGPRREQQNGRGPQAERRPQEQPSQQNRTQKPQQPRASDQKNKKPQSQAPSAWILKDDPKHSSNLPAKSGGGLWKRVTKIIQSFFKRDS